VPVEDIAHADAAVLAEAVARLRAGAVIREAGYDGEYGVIRLFAADELRRRTAGGLLFESPSSFVPPPERGRTAPRAPGGGPSEPVAATDPHPTAARSPSPLRGDAAGILAALDADQRAAASIIDGPLLIAAGPGSGKTRTLTHHIAHLVAEQGIA